LGRTHRNIAKEAPLLCFLFIFGVDLRMVGHHQETDWIELLIPNSQAIKSLVKEWMGRLHGKQALPDHSRDVQLKEDDQRVGASLLMASRSRL
jgi:hypothetical protein